jgi:type II secretory pathway pseudopilin PulG
MMRISGVVRSFLKYLRDSRGVSLYEITAAVAMTGILAAVAVPVVIEKTTEAKAARVVQETDAIFKAIQAFQRDTGKIPGTEEGVMILLSGPDGFHSLLPDGAGVAASGIPGVTINDSQHTCSAGCGNLNDYLVRDPNVKFGPINGVQTRYPNWKGPYVDEIFIDQFDRSYVVNVAALYKPEPAPPGKCGFAWVLSGGGDRFLATSLTSTALATNSDDIGKNNGKKLGTPNQCTAGSSSSSG